MVRMESRLSKVKTYQGVSSITLARCPQSANDIVDQLSVYITLENHQKTQEPVTCMRCVEATH